MPLDSTADLRFALWEVELLRNAALMREISDNTVTLEVTFYEHGEWHDFNLEVEDRDGTFSRPETFQAGDHLRFWVWFADRPDRTYMGEYTIDEIHNEAMPSRVRVTGLAADSVREDFRTLKTRGFEGMTLHGIAAQIAREHDLTPDLKGQDIELLRKEQKEEHDLRFLNRLAEQFGYVFRIEGQTLIYWQRGIAEAQEPLSLEGLLKRRGFRYKTFKTYRRARVRYEDPQKKQCIDVVVEDPHIKNNEELVSTERAESRQQAEEIAKARLKSANIRQVEAEIDCLGVPELKGGVNVIIAGEGALFDGEYHVKEAAHKYDKSSGYTVRLKAYLKAGGEPTQAMAA